MNTKTITMIKSEQLEHHPDNPRKNIGDIEELTASIAVDGILQNLTVVPKQGEADRYYVVIGNRRLEAGIAAGLEEFPCFISSMDYNKQLETMLVENINRSDLTPLEEAEGFKQLTLAGFTVDDIAEKTGFSKSTINRRLKIAEYNHDKAKKAIERGGTLEDFAKLEKIKTKREREKLLKAVGTADFNLEYKRIIEEQKNRELEKLALKELKTFAEPFPENENTWSSKWHQKYRLSYQLKDFKEGKCVPKKKNDSEKYFYIIHHWNSGWKVEVYTKNENYNKQPEKPKKTEQQKQTDRNTRTLNKMAKDHYELRKEFIMNLAKCSRIKDFEHICLDIVIRETASYGYINNNVAYNKIISEFFNFGSVYNNEDKLLEAYNANPAGTAVLLVYRLLEDNESKVCHHKYYDSSKVTFSKNGSLNLIYDFLTALGYEMSEEEKQYLNGTHPLFDKEKSSNYE